MGKKRNKPHGNKTLARVTRNIRRIVAICVCSNNENAEELKRAEGKTSDTTGKHINEEKSIDCMKVLPSVSSNRIPDPNDFIDIHQFDHLLKKNKRVVSKDIDFEAELSKR